MAVNDGLRSDSPAYWHPQIFDGSHGLFSFPELFSPTDCEKESLVSKAFSGPVSCVPRLELYTGVEAMEEKAPEAAQPGDKRLISEVFDRRLRKILEDEDVQKYLNTPSLLRQEPTAASRDRIKELKEIVSFSIKTANILKEACPCKELADKLFLDPQTGEACGVPDLVKRFEDINKKILDLHRSVSDPEAYKKELSKLETDWTKTLRTFPIVLDREEQMLELYFTETSGEEGKKLAKEYIGLRQSYIESFSKDNLQKGQSKHEFEMLKAGPRNFIGISKVDANEIELGKYSPKIHACWKELEKFVSSEKGYRARAYVGALDTIHAIRNESAQLLKLVDMGPGPRPNEREK